MVASFSVIAGSWRPLTRPEDASFFRDYDAVIATSVMGSKRSYEVYTYGQIIAERSSLDEAKYEVEMVYGPLKWRRIQLTPEEVTHYWFGPTTMFQDPLTIYVVDSLPRI